MFKKIIFFIFAVLVVFLVFVALGGTKFLQIKSMIDAGSSFVEPPSAISSFEAREEQWELTLPSIGTLEAARGLDITADLSGRVSKILFQAGQTVKKGELLIEQDTSSEAAQLRSAQSAADLAESTLNRVQELYRRQVASKSELDDAESNYDSAVANVDNIRASIEKKKIRAPFSGKLGIRLVNLGQSINAGDPVVSLQATNKMFINFSLPQQYLSQLSTGMSVRINTDAVPGEQFVGEINAVAPVIDTATRSIKIQALLDNPEQLLLPGMFASVEVVLPDVENVLIIPVTAVQYATYGDSIFIIQPKSTEEGAEASTTDEGEQLEVQQQFIQIGQMRGDFVTVEKGLEPGQLVASAGVFKLRNGAPVIINNSVVPDFQLEPQVEDK